MITNILQDRLYIYKKNYYMPETSLFVFLYNINALYLTIEKQTSLFKIRII